MNSEVDQKPARGKRPMTSAEYVGFVLVALSLGALFWYPGPVAGAFTAAAQKVQTIAFGAFISGMVGWAIICSVITGRLLERAGFTDALIRIFVPITRWIGVNPAVVIPGIYNILGDINAAGRITGPVLKQANATRDEQKIAIATMVQSQQSFSTFMLGIVCLTAAKVSVFPVIVVGLFMPLIVMPLLLKHTIYRDTKAVEIDDLPRYTPTTSWLPVLFGAAKEGAEVLFLIVIPATAAVFGIIGALEYAGIWQYIHNALTALLNIFSIDMETGMVSILASPTLAMGMLTKTAGTLPPKLVVGSFVLASSGLPLGVIFGQIPMIWKGVSDLNETEAVKAALVGIVLRIITAFLIAEFLTPLIMK
jgi:spore maturation protein SpmB